MTRPVPPSPSPTPLSEEIEATLQRHTIECWFPRAVDEDTGRFIQDFARDWSPAPPRPRSVVYQARMVWVAATLARRRPALPHPFARWAASGLHALERDFVSDDGAVRFWEGRDDVTHLYATAFVLFAAAAVVRATGSDHARGLGERILERLEAVGWDEEVGVYREALPVRSTPGTGVDLLGTPPGALSSNAQLHAVEALTEWARAVPDARTESRLERSLRWLEGVVAGEGAGLVRHYRPDGRPLDSVRSWGHDVEGFHLVDDARAILGWNGSSPFEAVARHAFGRGLDTRSGGLEAGRGRWRRDRRKIGWVQAEALTCAVRLHRRAEVPSWVPAPVDVWAFIRERMLDPVNGGWTEWERGRRESGQRLHKAHAWKACYHEVRALLEAADSKRVRRS
jgi:mannobiose 2-epimerase